MLLVTPGNRLLTTALATARIKRYGEVEIAEPSVLSTTEHRELAENGAFDLIIYDQCVPERMPRSNTLFIGTIPPTWLPAEKTVAEVGTDELNDDESSQTTEPQIDRVNNPQIIDLAKEHPLMAYIELGDIYISASNIVPQVLGGTVLVESTDGPLLSVAPARDLRMPCLGSRSV